MFKPNSNFLIIDDERCVLGKRLLVRGRWDANYKTIIEKEKIKELVLNEDIGWEQKDISFFSELRDTGLIYLALYSRKTTDVSVLAELKNLEILNLDCSFGNAPDFSNFEKLRRFSCDWRENAATIYKHPSLEELVLSKYPHKTIGNLAEMRSLKSLHVFSRALETLDNIETGANLTDIEFSYCPQLRDIGAIKGCSKLRRINFSKCKNIGDISAVKSLTDLEVIDLEDCGEIENLSALKHLKNLFAVRFIGNTKILDGDLSMLTKLPKLNSVSFQNRKNYSHTREQIWELHGRG